MQQSTIKTMPESPALVAVCVKFTSNLRIASPKNEANNTLDNNREASLSSEFRLLINRLKNI